MSSEPERVVLTPEGVPLRFRIALVGDRIGAFAIDATLVAAAVIAAVIAAISLAVALRGVALALGFVAFFLIRSFYFSWFECAWQGSTPGKRLVGIRVVDASGGALTPEAVLARNLTREIELFLPLTAALAPEALLPDVPAWSRYAGVAWLFVLALMPLFNRDRLRVGDLVAGTLVVRTPAAALHDDLSAPAAAREGATDIAFTSEQLDLYGIRELHVLETLLRQARPSPAALDAVAATIRAKIDWSPPGGDAVDAGRFLRAFYDAQRARLEQRLVLGERRETKRAGRLTRRP